MNFYAIADQITGEISRVVECMSDQIDMQLHLHEVAVEISANTARGVSNLSFYVSNGAIVEYTAKQIIDKMNRPLNRASWSNTTFSWNDEASLDEIRVAKWSEIKTARDTFEFGAFMHNNLVFDSNQISQQRIGQAAQSAMFAISVGAPFTQDWTLKDNSVVTFDAQQMMGVARAMGQHISYAHTRSQQLRVAIEAATTVEELKVINW